MVWCLVGCFVEFGGLVFRWWFWLDFAGLAPLASYSFVNSHKRVTRKRPPTSFAPKKAFGVPEFSAIAYEPALMRRPGAQG
jgi:hypothetical protein